MFKLPFCHRKLYLVIGSLVKFISNLRAPRALRAPRSPVLGKTRVAILFSLKTQKLLLFLFCWKVTLLLANVVKATSSLLPLPSFSYYAANLGWPIMLHSTKIIAGQCRTNPWPAVPDWTLMPECGCRTEAADYRKKCQCWTNFSPAFQHLHMIFQNHIARITQSAAAYGRAGCITFHYLQFGPALGFPFTTTNNSFFKCRNVGLSGIQSVRYRNEQNSDNRTSPVPE